MLVKKYTSECSDFIKDESNIIGDEVDAIVFPKSSQELSEYLKSNPNKVYFISGARTGVVGGAVPKKIDGKEVVLVSLSQNDFIDEVSVDTEGQATIKVGAGTSLYNLEQFLKESNSEYVFPVDPTEKWASFGGMASTNASGARSFYYSSVRSWIQEIEVVLVDGTIHNLKRGQDKLNNLNLSLGSLNKTLAHIPKPSTKNSIGYFCEPNCDLVDLFIGAEGTLGFITSLVLKLEKRDFQILSMLQFFDEAKAALNFIIAVRDTLKSNCLSLEYLDSIAINIAMESKDSLSSQVNDILANNMSSAVFLELKYKDDEEMATLYEELSALLESFSQDISNSICGTQDSEISSIKKFRHAVPEGINKKIAQRKLEYPDIRKVSTDMSVPDQYLIAVYDLYKNTLDQEGFEYCIMGHAGNNHFHVNLLPRNQEDMDKALKIYEVFARKIKDMGGAISAEHGIGRIKKNFLKIQYGDDILNSIKNIKEVFDPTNKLNPGILI